MYLHVSKWFNSYHPSHSKGSSLKLNSSHIVRLFYKISQKNIFCIIEAAMTLISPLSPSH